MNNFKHKILIFELLFIGFLIYGVLNIDSISRSTLAVIILVLSIVAWFIFKKRGIKSLYRKHVSIWMTVFALVYLGMFYALGLHFGFERSKVMFSIFAIEKFIIPIGIIIVSSEIIRDILLSQHMYVKIKSMRVNISTGIVYFSMVLIDMILYTGIYDLTNLDDFLVAIGFVLFAALSSNLLFNYISSRFGCGSIIAFRLITTLYVYLIPIVPSAHLLFNTILRIFCPYLIYLFLERFFSMNDFAISNKDKRKDNLSNSAMLLIVIAFVMLISCKFKYGLIVIATESMTGTINKGDAIIYESYKEQKIEKGQVLVFDNKGTQTVHRVVEIQDLNGQLRYFTEGDANAERDKDYITNENIYGLVKLRVKGIGFPTLWVRELFRQ